MFFIKNKIIYILLIIFLISIITIPSSLATDDNNIVIADNENNCIYFNSSALNDGDGSKDNPYNTLSENKIINNSNIYLADGMYNLGGSNYLLKNKVNISFVGENTQNTIITCNDNTWIYSNSSLLLTNLTFYNTNFYITNGNFTAQNVIFKDSSANLINDYDNTFGGSIYATLNSTVNLNNASFINTTGEYGGAIYINSGILNIIDSLFLNTYSYNFGGAIAGVNNTTININKTKISNTYSQNDVGGAVYVISSNLNVYSLEILYSQAYFGGAITSLSSNTNLCELNAQNNEAIYNGGALYVMYGNLNITDSLFSSNRALNGGAIFICNVSSYIYNTLFYQNNIDDIYSYFNQNLTFNNNSNCKLVEVSEIDYVTISEIRTLYNNYEVWEGIIPEYYNLASNGFVSPIKNQKSSDNCWAFTAMAVLESCILKASNMTYDLSEANMKNLMALYSIYGWNYVTNTGGFINMVLGYFTSWLGPVNEIDDEFDDYGVLSPVLDSLLHVQNAIFLKRANYTDNNAIKEAILKYGAVGSSLYFDNALLNKETNAYYVNQNYITNHAVTIVGWDDNYSRNNFLTTPSGDGAWIIKNSWGESWGDNGYFYVSYYDDTLVKVGEEETAYTFILNDPIVYEKNYQYDLKGKDSYSYYPNYSTSWYKNIFTSTEDEYLAAVSTYFKEATDWEVNVYVGDELKANKTGVSNPGYHTINLDEFIKLNKGDVFSVIFKITTDGIAYIPISSIEQSSMDIFSANHSFISFNGINWEDTYGTSKSNVCIKAFTIVNEVNANINLIINETNIKANVYNQYGNLINKGNITFIINNKSFSINIINGTAGMDYIFDENTLYEVSAIFEGTGYNKSSVHYAINTDINFMIDDVNYGDNITVNIPSVEKANLKVVIDNNEYIVLNDSFEINNVLNVGEYTAYLYNKSVLIKSIKFKVVKANLLMNITHITDLNDIQFNIKFNKKINDTLTITLCGESFVRNLVDGEDNFILTLDKGNYDLNVLFNSNNYNIINRTCNFDVDVYRTQLIANNTTTQYTDYLTYAVNLKTINNQSIACKTIKLTVNNNEYVSSTDNNGIAYFYMNLDVGEYNFNINFDGDDNYGKSNISTSINIRKAEIDATLSLILNYTSNIFRIKFSKNINDTVKLTVLNQTYEVNIVNGNGEFVVYPDFDYGEYDVTLFFENKNYQTLNKITTCIVNYYRIGIDVSVLNNYVGETLNLIFDFNSNSTEDVTGEFSILVNNVLYNRTIVNNKVILTIDGLSYGDYNLIALYGFQGIFSGKLIDYNFTIFKAKTSQDIPNIAYGENLTVTFTDGTTGDATLTINNITQTVKLVNSKATFKTDDLKIATYPINIEYNSDNYYTNTNVSTQLTVEKGNMDLNITITQNSTNTIFTMMFSREINGSLIFTIQNKSYNINITKGKSTFIGNLYDYGSYELNILFKSDNYKTINKTHKFDIIMYQTKIIADNITSPYADYLLYKVNLTTRNNQPIINKIIKITANNKEYINTTNSNGIAYFYINLNVGEYNFNINFDGDDNYGKSNINTTVNIQRVYVEINASLMLNYTSNVFFIESSKKINETVTVTVLNQTYDVDIKNGTGMLLVYPDFDYGQYDVNIFLKNKNYNSINKTIRFYVTFYRVGIDVNVLNNYVGENLTFIFNFSSNSTKKITGDFGILVNNTLYKRTIVNNQAVLTVNGLSYGNYTLEALYDPQDVFSGKLISYNFTVLRTNSSIDIPNNITYGENLTVVFTDGTTGDATLTINNITQTVSIINSKATFKTNNINAGSYPINIHYSGDDAYNSSDFDLQLNIQKINFDLDLILIQNSTNTIFNIYLTKNLNTTLVLTILNESFKINTTNGNVSFIRNLFDYGIYDVNIYSKYDNYNDLNKTITLNLKGETLVNIPNSINYGENIVIKFTNGTTGNATLSINNYEQTVSIINSKATFNTVNLKGTTYNFNIYYSGDNRYNSTSITSQIKINKLNTNFVLSSSSTFNIINPAYCTLIFKDINNKILSNKNIIITFSGKTYKLKTDGNGLINLKLDSSSSGNKLLSIKFAGDDYYASSSIQKTIKVTKDNVKISVPNKNYKKSAKTKKLTVTLKNSLNKVIKSVKVTFKVNGKTYSAKTNSKGVASVNVKITKKGSYKVVTKFGGNSYYNSISKTSKLKIK